MIYLHRRFFAETVSASAAKAVSSNVLVLRIIGIAVGFDPGGIAAGRGEGDRDRLIAVHGLSERVHGDIAIVHRLAVERQADGAFAWR